jgi:hypothetical protein
MGVPLYAVQFYPQYTSQKKTATLHAFFSPIFSSVMYLEIQVRIPDSFEHGLGDS